MPRSTSARRAVRAAVVAVTAAALLLPGTGALAAEPQAGPVEVTAMVQDGDGGVRFVHSHATTARRGHDLVRRWRGDRRVLAAAVDSQVRLLSGDPLRGQQWGLTRLRAEQVWQLGSAGSQVVAVLDTGVDAAHPDLARVVLPGYDLLGSGRATTDPHGHGTHVAGVVAALGNNGIGGAGLGRGARVLPIRVLDASGWGSDSDVAKGIVWAVDNGATVVNLSLGGTSPSSLMTAAIDYAGQRGVVVVAATGNSGKEGNPVLYPAASPGVVAVGAIGQDGTRPDWASTGGHLSVVAPGAGILSTVPGGGYQAWTGTSMAAPFVSAAVALLKEAEPALTPAQVRARLMATAQDLGAPGHDATYGAGLVDVLAARAAGLPPVPAPAPAPEAEPAPLPAPAADPEAPAASEPAPPGPAPAAPRTSTPAVQPAPAVTLRSARSAGEVVPGRAVHLSSRALRGASPAGGVPLELERRVDGAGWAVVRRASTGADGLVVVSLQPDRGASYRFRSGEVVGEVLRVDVRQVVTATGSRKGRTVQVDVRVAPGGAAAVALQVKRGGGWATVATATTNGAGAGRLSAALPARSTVRVHVPARTGLLPGTSSALVR